MPIAAAAENYPPHSARNASQDRRGRDYIMSGGVTKKWEKDGEKVVDMDIAVDTKLGAGAPCIGTLAIPAKALGPPIGRLRADVAGTDR